MDITNVQNRNFYVNMTKRTGPAFETDRVAATSFNKLIPVVSGPYDIVIVYDSTLAVLEDGI